MSEEASERKVALVTGAARGLGGSARAPRRAAHRRREGPPRAARDPGRGRGSRPDRDAGLLATTEGDPRLARQRLHRADLFDRFGGCLQKKWQICKLSGQ